MNEFNELRERLVMQAIASGWKAEEIIQKLDMLVAIVLKKTEAK